MSTLESLTRHERRAASRHLERENQNWPATLVEVPRDQWPHVPPKLQQVWRSREFLVQVFAEGPVTRLSVNRASVGKDARWSDNITWDELQRLKRETGFGDLDAVEVFPADGDVVNVANMRHLWILPAPLPFAWRA